MFIKYLAHRWPEQMIAFKMCFCRIIHYLITELKGKLYDSLVCKNISAAKAITVTFNQRFQISVITLHFCVKTASGHIQEQIAYCQMEI